MQVSTSESRDCLGWQSTKCKRRRTCIKCGEGGKVLDCEKCPIEIHEICMNCPAQLDDLGKFHCPYCLYRQSVQECLQAKDKVMLAKKAAILSLLGKEGEQTPSTEGLIMKILLQKRKFDASYKRTKANHDINQPKKLEEQKQERALQGSRSKIPREGAEVLVINEQRNASALGDNGIQQIHPDCDTVIVNQVYLESRIFGKSCVKELTDKSVCGVEQENIAEKDVSKAVEVEQTIQLKCSVLDDGYEVKGHAQDKEQVEQLDTLYEEGPTSSEPVVRGVMTKNHDFVQNSEQSSLTKDKEQHIEHTPEESQGSSGYPMTIGRVTEIRGKPDNLDESCSSCPDHRMRRRRVGSRKGARDGKHKTAFQPVGLPEDDLKHQKLVRSFKSRNYQKSDSLEQSTVSLMRLSKSILPWTVEEEDML